MGAGATGYGHTYPLNWAQHSFLRIGGARKTRETT